MKRVMLLVALGLTAVSFIHPMASPAQESPRRDPTAAAPAAAALPPVSPTTAPVVAVPATRPAFAAVHGRDGFWRVARDAAGTWWFVAPDGRTEFLNSVTTVQPQLRSRTGADYISADWNPLGEHDAELDHWAQATLKRVRDAGFKGLGAWSHPILHKYDVPMTRDLNVWAWLRERSTRLFTPDWSVLAEATIRTQVEPLRENHNLVGYYVDNELDWSDPAVGPGVYFDDLGPGDPNRAEVVRVIHNLWATVADFNAAWTTDLKEWADLDALPQLPREPAGAYRKLGSAWLSHLAEAYFRTTTELVRRHDPNHLILGVRFRGAAVPEVVAASKDYTDAQSLNYYVSDARLDRDMFRMINELSGQPLVITEYSFHALDGRSGNRNTVGFPAQVLDQQARAEGYRQFTTRLARVPFVIGADWFQWMDEPPSGRRNDGEDVNFGVVDIDDRPYDALIHAIRDTAAQLNGLHEASRAGDEADLWRDGYAADQVHTSVPFLTTPIRLNGELSDWPASAQVGGIRPSQSVGSDRCNCKPPKVNLGWTNEGLYLGFEVYDSDVTTAPASGWWWARDSVEFFISTRPVSSDQTGYDDHNYHFFFVPSDSPGMGTGGVVGQWHSPGDGLKANLIPHPDARCAVRILPDRYVAEIFIPAKSLNGFAEQNEMAFNIHVKDFQHAQEFFWSAPKQVLTQARPNTWGRAILQPKAVPVPVAPIAGAGLESR